MKTNINILQIFFLITLLFIIPGVINAQIYSEKREQSKSFKLKSGVTVQISNKYGNINVLPWEKDSVRIEVSMSAQSKQAAKVVKILSSIDCEMMSTATFISARTVFYDNTATFWKDVVAYAGQVINASNNLQINYTVYMPASNDIKIDNKFGNVYMDSHKGKADITIANGDLQARKFSSSLKLKLEFGSASMQDVDEAQLSINYSDLTLRKSNTINLISRSSTIDIEEVTTLDIASQRDKLVVKSCYSINGDASFSRIRINELESTSTMNTKYGEYRLNNITRNFRSINLKSEYTDIFLGFNPSDSYSLDLIYDAKTSLNITPQIYNQLKKDILNLKLGTVQANGNIGKAGTSHVSVSAKAGSLSLLYK